MAGPDTLLKRTPLKESRARFVIIRMHGYRKEFAAESITGEIILR